MTATDMSSQHYVLRWNNHRANLLSVFDELLQHEEFTDVTLVADDGSSLKCHKMVLVACSSYFQRLFHSHPYEHPIVVLKDVKLSEIKALLDYMYRGEVNVAQNHLCSLLKVADMLKIKGLIEESSTRPDNREVETSTSPPPAISTSTGVSNVPHSSSHASPPHSTGSSHSALYGGDIRSAGAVDRRNAPGLTMPTLQLTDLSLPPSATSVYPSSSYSQHPAYPGTSIFKRRKMSQSISSLMNRDTPILRTVLGQGQADSSQMGMPLLHSDSHEGHSRSNSNGSANDNDRRSVVDQIHTEMAHSPYTDVVDEDEKQRSSPQSYTTDNKSGILNYVVPPQKPEWKRYKQYTRDDIQSAIEAVKNGMSAVQAARKFGVPSRTLYDKVKKLGITTSRPIKRERSNGSGSGASFPYGIGGNVNGGIYSNMCESDLDAANTISMMEGAVGGAALDTIYNKPKDLSLDRGNDDHIILDVGQGSPSPIIRCVKQQESDLNDQVEDLSVSRKSDVPVMVPTASDTIKEETQDIMPDERCDYN